MKKHKKLWKKYRKKILILLKKKKKLFKKKLKEVEATKKLSPLERIRASIKGNSPSVGILNDDILPNVSKLIKDSLKEINLKNK